MEALVEKAIGSDEAKIIVEHVLLIEVEAPFLNSKQHGNRKSETTEQHHFIDKIIVATVCNFLL